MPAIRYLTTSQLARELGIGTRTLQQWVYDGRIEPDFRTAGGHMRWDQDRVMGELRAGMPRARHRPPEQGQQ